MTAEHPQTRPPNWQEHARAAARGASSGSPAPLRELVAFELSGDGYAVPVERVREIVRMRPITAIPRMTSEIRGVVSLRGQMVQVLDLRRRLGLPAASPSRRTRIIVLHGDEGEVTALLVDAVRSVLRVAEAEIQPPPGGESPLVCGLCASDGAFVSLLELDRVMELDAA